MILLWPCRSAEIRWLFRFVVAVVLLWGALPTLSVHAETAIVPTLSVRSWYDTNVYRRPKQLLTPGTQAEDFVTSVLPVLDLLHKTRDIEAEVKLGGLFTVYAHNTNRNYVGGTLQGGVNLDHWVDQYVRGARLRVAENLRYTPEQPSFLQGARDLPLDVSLTTGTQGFRANMLYNVTQVTGGYSASRDLSVEGGYTFTIRRIGRVQGGLTDLAGTTLYFDTMAHSWFGGPRYHLTRNDSVAVLYKQTFITQSQATGGRNFNTNLVALVGDYTKEFQEWRFIAQGGITFAEPVGRAFPSGKLEVTNRLERDTVVRLALSREGRPSFFLAGGAMISNLASLGISHTIYERLTLDGTVGYAYNEYFPNTDKSLKNFTASSRLSYKLTRDITGQIFYIFQNIDSTASSLEFQYSRNQVGFMLSAEWK
ncbi:MAG: hypothetical protein NTAFB01_15030 [Nitrospira sp.]